MNRQELDEDDLKAIFHDSFESHNNQPEAPKQEPVKKIRRESRFWLGATSVLKTLALFVVLFIISFTVLNFPALWLQGKYFWQVNFLKKPLVAQSSITPVISYNNYLFISEIGVNAPISWNVPADQTLPALEHGVAHYQGTALPGQIGNVFISGHSSFYWWDGGSFKEIFALLDKLKIGDKIYISYQNQLFTYVITSKKVVSPNDLTVLDQTNTKTLSLMTCVPVGTNLNRLVVIAQQL
jgi:LPXTG-site transpeptidase (sortase) family protein